MYHEVKALDDFENRVVFFIPQDVVRAKLKATKGVHTLCDHEKLITSRAQRNESVHRRIVTSRHGGLDHRAVYKSIILHLADDDQGRTRR